MLMGHMSFKSLVYPFYWADFVNGQTGVGKSKRKEERNDLKIVDVS